MAASSPIHLALLSALLLLLASGSATARPGVYFGPCKTLFISYTVTSSSGSSPSLSAAAAAADEAPSRLYAVYRVIRPIRVYSFRGDGSVPVYLPRPLRVLEQPVVPATERLSPSGIANSLRERAKDILVVVVSLLFGVGCGALTAATMYLAWSLFVNRYEVCGSEEYEYDEDEDEIESPKKMGYASIPPVPATPASPVKEGYEGN